MLQLINIEQHHRVAHRARVARHLTQRGVGVRERFLHDRQLSGARKLGEPMASVARKQGSRLTAAEALAEASGPAGS